MPGASRVGKTRRSDAIMMVLKNTWLLKKFNYGLFIFGLGACGYLVEVLLGEFVVLGALLAGNEPGQTEFLAGLLGGLDPLVQSGVLELLLSVLVRLLGDDLAPLVHAQVLLGETTLGPVNGAAPYSSHGPVLDSGLAGRAGLADGALGHLLGGFAGGPSALGRSGRLGLAGGLAGGSAGGALGGAWDLGGPAAGDAFGGSTFDGHCVVKVG